MIKLLQNKEALANLNKYMFTGLNMKKGYDAKFNVPIPSLVVPATLAALTLVPAVAALTLAEPTLVSDVAALTLAEPTLVPDVASLTLVPATLVPATLVPAVAAPKRVSAVAAPSRTAKPFIPFQRDKLFWCFYIILHGYEEYEMNHSNSFSLEKQIKIETVEKLKSIKEKLKELKLKRTELEDELVNKQTITLKGLYALCLVHNVSITYIYGRKYCEIVAQPGVTEKKGIIIQNEKKEDALKWTSNEINQNNDFLTQIRNDYWLIENIQKPLNAPSAYSVKELQDICEKLKIDTHTTVNDKSKAKTKTKLYEEILMNL